MTRKDLATDRLNTRDLRVAWKYEGLPIPPFEKSVHLIYFVRVFQKI
jgi:hypothetical protein